MAEKQKNELNEAQIIAFLQDIVTKIQTEEDPLELNQFRRLFKKVVPFYLRSYFAAYLLKQINAGRAPRIQVSSNQGGRGDRTDRNDRGDRNEKGGRGEQNGRTDRNDRSGRSDRPNRGEQARGEQARGEQGRGEQGERSERQKRGEGRKRDGEGRSSGESRNAGEAKAEPRNVLPDDVSTTLFVSIGRNRRVYPRDLIGLIMQNVEIEREHVGDIRVLDNYSFVQVITEDAQKIIDALNEFEYRGRKLAVSFSRKKEESSDAAATMVSGISADGSRDTDGVDTSDSDTSDSFDAEGSIDGDSNDEVKSDDEVMTDGSDEIEEPVDGEVADGNGSPDAEPDDDEKNDTNV